MICAPYKELSIPKNLNNRNWEKALEWLKSDAWKDLPPGKTEIDGSRVYVTRYSYTSKLRSGCLFEAHRLRADVHMVIKGNEIVPVCAREGLKTAVPYSDEKDAEMFEGEPDSFHNIVLAFPMALVVFPRELHMPSVALDDRPAPVEKIVLKVEL